MDRELQAVFDSLPVIDQGVVDWIQRCGQFPSPQPVIPPPTVVKTEFLCLGVYPNRVGTFSSEIPIACSWFNISLGKASIPFVAFVQTNPARGIRTIDNKFIESLYRFRKGDVGQMALSVKTYGSFCIFARDAFGLRDIHIQEIVYFAKHCGLFIHKLRETEGECDVVG